MVINDPTGYTLPTTFPAASLERAFGWVYTPQNYPRALMILFADFQDADPLILGGDYVDDDQIALVLANLRADLEWVELTTHAAGGQTGATATSSLFVRISDIEELKEGFDRPFHGPAGIVALPDGLTVTLTNGQELGTWIRAVGDSADRLRGIVRDDWQPKNYPIRDALI
jgi:hypothetical protein